MIHKEQKKSYREFPRFFWGESSDRIPKKSHEEILLFSFEARVIIAEEIRREIVFEEAPENVLDAGKSHQNF